LIFWKYSSRWI